MHPGTRNHNRSGHHGSTILKRAAALSASIVLAACATAPPPEKVDNLWDGYSSVAISPNGRLAAAANQTMVVLFDIEQRRQVGWFWAVDEKGKSFKLRRSGIGDTLEFVDNHRIASTGMGGLATVWDVRTGEKLMHFDPPGRGIDAISLAYAPAIRKLALGTRNGTIVLAHLEGERAGETELLLSHVDRINDMVFSSDGRYMASAGHDRAVLIWDMESRQEIARHDANGDISDLEVIESRRELIIAGDDVAIWKFLTEEEATELREDKAVGQWVGTGALYALQVGLIATGFGGGLSTHDPQNCGRFIAASPDGRYLVDVKPGPMANKVTVLDLELNEILHEVGVKSAICDLEFTNDGALLALVGDGGLFLVDTATWTTVPVRLIVDGFSYAPRVILAPPGRLGLSVTGYRAGEQE